jgi:uncharacterized protein
VGVLEALALLAAGVFAGAINAVVGSGTLVTFPTLLAFGYAPVTANVSNNIGVLPGSITGAIAYRRELRGQRARVQRLAVGSVLGGAAGALLLLELPASAFDAVVPVLILLGCVLVIAQPWLSSRVAQRPHSVTHGGPLLFVTVFATGVYGGYFGAAQGVLLMAFLGIFLNEDLQRLNATKNVLAGLVNAVASIIFVVVSHVAWGAALMLAIGSTAGGHLGGTLGRRVSPPVLRGFIVVVGVTAAVRLLAT